MLRDKNLIPLSHQHQRALALCVRIDRASPIAESDSAAWNAELQQIFRREIAVHFSAEEQIVFPAAGQFKELAALVEDLLVDHAALREYLAKSEEIGLTGGDLAACGKRLSDHVRKEERQLFEELQKRLTSEELERLGDRLAEALKAADETCLIPNQTTKLRAGK